MSPSRYLSLLVFLLSLVLGIICEVKKDLFFSFVDDSKGDGITQKDIDLLKKYFNIINYTMFALAGEQLYRYLIKKKKLIHSHSFLRSFFDSFASFHFPLLPYVYLPILLPCDLSFSSFY